MKEADAKDLIIDNWIEIKSKDDLPKDASKLYLISLKGNYHTFLYSERQVKQHYEVYNITHYLTLNIKTPPNL